MLWCQVLLPVARRAKRRRLSVHVMDSQQLTRESQVAALAFAQVVFPNRHVRCMELVTLAVLSGLLVIGTTAGHKRLKVFTPVTHMTADLHEWKVDSVRTAPHRQGGDGNLQGTQTLVGASGAVLFRPSDGRGVAITNHRRLGFQSRRLRHPDFSVAPVLPRASVRLARTPLSP
jgi:hypothetical protein